MISKSRHMTNIPKRFYCLEDIKPIPVPVMVEFVREIQINAKGKRKNQWHTDHV